MTEQKSLKRLVRERMSRTGESYTTAHRHVTARRGPAEAAPAAYEPGLVPGYSSFGPERHQPSAMVRHMLAAAGVDVSEPMACGLGGGVGFLYAVFEYRQIEHPLLTIVAQHHPMPWLSAVAQNLGLELETVHSSSATAARRKLDACLDRGEPAQLAVGRGLLPQHADVSPLEAADPYQVVVAGRHGDEYLTDDLATTPHLIDGEMLLKAWAAHRKGRFEQTTLVRRTTELIARDSRPALVDATGRAIELTADHLTGPVLGNSFDVNFGLSGMRKLADELRDGSTRHGWQRRFATPAHVQYACRRLAECLTSAHTAAAATRPLYARFLAEVQDLVPSRPLAGAVTCFEGSGRSWAGLAQAAQSAAAQGDGLDPASLFASFADRVEECVALEERAVALLREHLAVQRSG
jgi:Domain of unknown function (DUF4872)/Butirosin biosynthesis protein H, N-terminal